MRILVVGGYGLIGGAIVRALLRDGRDVVGLGRSAKKGKALLPDIEWIEADISTLTSREDWREITATVDVVVNASGALQTGHRDNLGKVQRDAITALIAACEDSGVDTFIQISAPDASETSDTAFYRTKAAADTALKASGLRWTIFRPGLVISPHAYGGTSLLRALAAFPVVQPVVLAGSTLQTVAVDDVADAVCYAIDEDLTGGDFDLVAPGRPRLSEVVLGFRRWLGFRPPWRVISVPKPIGRGLAALADAAGWLGWRSPLRTTALKVLSTDVTGDADKWPQNPDTLFYRSKKRSPGCPRPSRNGSTPASV